MDTNGMTDAAEIRVLLAEDQTLVRQALRTILELESGITVVGEASNGAEAVSLTRELRPDLVLMDIQMPVMDGVDATFEISGLNAASRVIVLTTFDSDEYVFEAIKAGAAGYLLKDVPATELIETMHKVHAGEAVIQPSIASKLLVEFGRADKREREPTSESLSERELEVLRLLADGASNRDIGQNLFLAEGTVKNHVSSILAKLHAANRTQAVSRARTRGLID